jgi:radical SAM protein with 4Fe4S-binding SPASM domain
MSRTSFHFFIQWHLTERCNLRCRHCYQHGDDASESSTDEILREIDSATEMFRAWEGEEDIQVVPAIHFTGGEPFLHEDFRKIMDYAGSQGYRLAIMTNGCLVTREIAQWLKRVGIDDIQVSIEGPAAIHDMVRGKGSFAAARQGIEFLVEEGNTVSVNVTLSRLNAHAVEETAILARDMGAAAAGFSRMVPCGAGEVLLGQILGPQETRAVYETIIGLNGRGFKVMSGDPLFGTLSGYVPPWDCSLTLSGCSAGFSGVTIDSHGYVMPCRRIGLRAGHLKDKSLREIWSGSDLLWCFRRKESYHAKCSSCRLWPSCRGCRAVAYAYSKALGRPDLFADDPQCWHS